MRVLWGGSQTSLSPHSEQQVACAFKDTSYFESWQQESEKGYHYFAQFAFLGRRRSSNGSSAVIALETHFLWLQPFVLPEFLSLLLQRRTIRTNNGFKAKCYLRWFFVFWFFFHFFNSMCLSVFIKFFRRHGFESSVFLFQFLSQFFLFFSRSSESISASYVCKFFQNLKEAEWEQECLNCKEDEETGLHFLWTANLQTVKWVKKDKKTISDYLCIDTLDIQVPKWLSLSKKWKEEWRRTVGITIIN